MTKIISIAVMIISLLVISFSFNKVSFGPNAGFIGQLAAEEEKEKKGDTEEQTDVVGMIRAKPYGDVIVKLEAEHSRGYRWIVNKSYDKKLLEYLSVEFVRPKNRMEGTPGVEVWYFRALKEGETMLTFTYAKPSLPDIAPLKKKTYRIVVMTPTLR